MIQWGPSSATSNAGSDVFINRMGIPIDRTRPTLAYFPFIIYWSVVSGLFFLSLVGIFLWHRHENKMARNQEKLMQEPNEDIKGKTQDEQRHKTNNKSSIYAGTNGSSLFHERLTAFKNLPLPNLSSISLPSCM